MKQLLLVKKVQTGSIHGLLGIQSILRRYFYNSQSKPPDSFHFFQDPTLKPPIRITLLKPQYQKVWLFSGFSRGELPVPLDQFTLLKTFFPAFYCCWIWFKRGPSAPATSPGEFCTFTQLLRFVPMQKLELLHLPPSHTNDVKELMDPKKLLHDHF